MSLGAISKPARTVAYVELNAVEGSHSQGGGRKTRVSLALPSDARLRYEIMPEARVGGIKESPQQVPDAQKPKRAVVVAEFIPPLLDWMRGHGKPMTTNEIAHHSDVTALAGKTMSSNAMHSILDRMRVQGLLERDYLIVKKPGAKQTYAGRSCLWRAAK